MRYALVLLLAAGCPKPAPVDSPAKTARGQLPEEAGLAKRPEDLPVTALAFEPPEPAAFRHELDGGVPLWVATSDEFPLVQISMTFKGGKYLEPAGHAGLARMTGSLIRSGGSKSKTPEALDEAFDFLAADVRVSVGNEFASADLNCLKDNLEECLDLFVEMLREPRFDASRTQVYKDGWLARLEQRNDDASDILSYEWNALLFGRDHYLGRIEKKSDIDAIDAADMKKMHARIFHPGNMSVQVSGAITADAVKPLLEKRFAGWAKGEPVDDPPAPTAAPAPGVYHVQKDIPQGKVRIGMRGITRDDPDAIAIEVMNDILGGGGFTSRITKRVRSDEGLAYTARSAFQNRVYFPGIFLAFTESKSETVAFATKIMMDEITRIRTEPVSAIELDTARAALIETFPRTFESKAATLDTFADDAWTGRDPGYWKAYRENVAKVDAARVTEVAAAHLDPAKAVILIVGDWEPIAKGDLEGHATMADFFGGEVTHLPLRDPLTDAPL
ncbi:MAG: insulinase family protein [Alphaproteobacteria bacterium]|nr:insulinase family protein [Alphaproteobacteria bacterium]